jgi:hypothetical protein
MTSARVVALVGILLMAAVPMIAAGQSVPVPQPAPKKGTQQARPPAAPAPMQTDAAGRPVPVRPPAESVP